MPPRAWRLRASKDPKPTRLTFLPATNSSMIVLVRVSTTSSTCFLEIWLSLAETVSIKLALFIVY